MFRSIVPIAWKLNVSRMTYRAYVALLSPRGIPAGWCRQGRAGAGRCFDRVCRVSSCRGLRGLVGVFVVVFSGIFGSAGLLVGEAEDGFEVGQPPPTEAACEEPESFGDT